MTQAIPDPRADQTEPSRARVPRWLRWGGIGLAAFLLLLLALVFVLPKTGPGQGLIDRVARPIVEEQVRAQLGSEIDFGPIGGALPGELILTDIVLSERGDPWLTVGRVRLDWSPLALLRGDIVVDSLVVTDADLRRMPPPRPEQPAPSEDSGPWSLPSLRVERFAVEPLTLREPVFGTAYVLTAQARLEAAGQDVQALADVATASGSDRLAADIAYDPERLTASLRVEGAPDGLIADLSGAGGPVDVALDGEGPLEAWSGRLAAALGRYGSAEAALSGDLKGLTNARLTGEASPGPGLPDAARQVAGETLRLDVATARDGEALNIAVAALEGRFGALSGTVRLGSLAAETVSADLSGRLTETVTGEFGVPYVAGPVSLRAEAARAGEGWTASGTLTTEAFEARVAEGRTDAETTFAGRLSLRSARLEIGQDRLDPITREGVRASADVTVPATGPIRVANLDAALGSDTRRVAAGGWASFDPETSRFEASLTAQARRGALEILAGTGSYDGPLDLRVTASGTPEDARVDLAAQLPSGTLDGVAFSPGRLTADVAGLPGAPSGEVRIASRDGDYEGEMTLRRDGALVRVPALRFASGGLNLDGEGAVNPETGALRAALTLDAGRSATLITGQTVAGQAALRAEIGPDGGPVDVAVEASGLGFETNTVEALRLTARGPLDAVAFDLDAEGLVAADRFFPFLRADGTADVATPQRVVRLAAFAAALGSEADEDRITLLAPTTIEFGEAIALAETRLDWLGEGRVVAQGRYAPDLWAAEVTAQDVAVPGQPLAANLDLSVDTGRAEIAVFEARLRTTDEDLEERFAVVADGRWAGDRLSVEANLAPEGQAPFGEAVIGFPLVLTRTDGVLGVALPEEGLEGRIRYASSVEPLYAFAGIAGEPLTGRLDADVTLAGAVTAPEARGTARLREGRFEEERFGFALRDIGVAADFAYTGDETVVTVSGEAADADGDASAVTLSGDVRIGADRSAVDVRVALDDAQLSDSAQLELQADGDIALTGPLTDLALAGALRIDELDAAIPELGGDDVPEYVAVEVVRVDGPEADRVGELAEPPPPPFEVALDLAIEANNAVFIRGRGLDSEWRIDMTVGGTTRQPVVGGEIALLDGTFDFAGRAFDLTRGFINFQRQDEINPRLDIEAELDVDEVTAVIGVTGPAQDPEIRLSSNPPRPQEDVMALILFGKQPTELTALESLQIANAVAKLTGTSPLGGGGPGITDKLRSGLGLDALSLGLGADGNAQVGIGKYVTDDLYVSARQSAGDVGTEVIVTYEVTDDVTLESTLKPDGNQGVSANFKKDY